MSEVKDIKTKSELMDSFVQIAIAKGYSDYEGEAARFINETVDMYSNLPQPQLTIPKSIADILDSVFNEFVELRNNANSLMIKTIFTHYESEDPFYKWFNEENKSYNISIIYFANKNLGGEIIEITEG